MSPDCRTNAPTFAVEIKARADSQDCLAEHGRIFDGIPSGAASSRSIKSPSSPETAASSRMLPNEHSGVAFGIDIAAIR